MSTPETQNAYAQGYHVGYQHGLEAAGKAGGTGYPIDLVARYPQHSSRLLMFFWLFKPLMLLPHLIILWLLGIAVGFVMFIAWFAVVFTGNYPRALWDFMVGVNRWSVRMQAWMVGLTDEYPPFSLS